MSEKTAEIIRTFREVSQRSSIAWDRILFFSKKCPLSAPWYKERETAMNAFKLSVSLVEPEQVRKHHRKNRKEVVLAVFVFGHSVANPQPSFRASN